MATMQLPAMGYGLRYEYGIFRQTIEDGWQREQPDNWLRRPDPWEVARPNEKVEVKLNCSFELRGGSLQRRSPASRRALIGIPFDRPVVGYGGKTINTLRLWAAAAPDYFDFQAFSGGDFVGALAETLAAESLTRVLYPDDSTSMGQGLRFVQEYFLVACSLADLVRRFRRSNADWNALPEKVAIQLNDTHPAMAVPELMRILLDEAQLGWDEAWDLTRRTLAYTNHTLLARGAGEMAGRLVRGACCRGTWRSSTRSIAACSTRSRTPLSRRRGPRRAASASSRKAGERKVRMANLAIVGSHSTNGVAAIHSSCCARRRSRTSPRCSPSGSTTRPTASRRGAGCCWPIRRWPAPSPTRSATAGSPTSASSRSLKPLADDNGFRDDVPQGQARGQDAVRRLAQGRRPGRWSTRTPSSIARSSASTNTSGNCSTRCASSCSTTGCARTRASTCRRGRSSSPARRRRPIASPS